MAVSTTQPPTTADKFAQQLARLERKVDALLRHATLAYRPTPIKIYKPSSRDPQKGAALKVDLRLDPVYETSEKGTEFIKEVDGGLFFEHARQVGHDADGNAEFGWKEPAHRMVVLMGVPDIAAFLLTFRSRWAKRALPVALLKRDKDTREPVPDTISLFHKAQSFDTVIEYKVDPEGGFLSFSRITKGQPTDRRAIRLSLADELQLEIYLQQALSLFQQVGMR